MSNKYYIFIECDPDGGQDDCELRIVQALSLSKAKELAHKAFLDEYSDFGSFETAYDNLDDYLNDWISSIDIFIPEENLLLTLFPSEEGPSKEVIKDVK